uniref:Uncharacterized protein n=1 Tax=Siphoviridae sp. ctrpg19 TaxID=2826481 RepID=A0A8S5MKH0_9CAUD|nr:MAG TPA: hypothetical protein [Siphoviridae sp. ctrpg19]
MQTQVKASAIVSDGINALTDNDWYIYHAKQNNLTLAEMQIITLAEGAVVGGELTVNEVGNDPVAIENAWYQESPTAEDIVNLVIYPTAQGTDEVALGWRISSKLNLLMSPDTPQELLEHQEITVKTSDDKTSTIKGTGSGTSYKSKYVMSNKILAFSGGKDLSVTTQDETNIDIYSYDRVELPKDSDNKPTQYNSDGTIQLKM